MGAGQGDGVASKEEMLLPARIPCEPLVAAKIAKASRMAKMAAESGISRVKVAPPSWAFSPLDGPIICPGGGHDKAVPTPPLNAV